MSCNTPQIIIDEILCAKTCTVKFNDQPVAALGYTGTTLFDDSIYFDDGIVSPREIRWTVYSEGVLIYDFEFNSFGAIVSELSNGSTYGAMDLGALNADILTFIEGLPNTIVPVGTKLTILIDVRDNTGVASENISNKYCFTK